MQSARERVGVGVRNVGAGVMMHVVRANGDLTPCNRAALDTLQDRSVNNQKF